MSQNPFIEITSIKVDRYASTLRSLLVTILPIGLLHQLPHAASRCRSGQAQIRISFSANFSLRGTRTCKSPCSCQWDPLIYRALFTFSFGFLVFLTLPLSLSGLYQLNGSLMWWQFVGSPSMCCVCLESAVTWRDYSFFFYRWVLSQIMQTASSYASWRLGS